MNEKVIEFEKEIKKLKSKKRNQSKNKRASSEKNQIHAGDNGIQIRDVSGDVNIKISKARSKKVPLKAEITVTPPEGSIGSDPHLRQTIQNIFDKIAKARQDRLGVNPYGALYKNFKKDFQITGKYTDYLLWPKSCAPAIIEYLQDKYNNTIPGKIKKASKRADYIHTRDHLYRIEEKCSIIWELNGKARSIIHY
jgi:hypothetical protein